MLYYLVLQLLLATVVVSMPYQVPLQGIEGGKRTLVIVDSKERSSSYSTFFGQLTRRGHKLSFFRADSEDLRLKHYGEKLYDNIVFFASGAEKLSGVTFDELLEFSNDGGNILLGLHKEVSDSVRDFVQSLGMTVHRKNSEVIDHFHHSLTTDLSLQHVHVLTNRSSNSAPILGAYVAAGARKLPVMFHGVGLSAPGGDGASVLLSRVLEGESTAYSAIPNKSVGDAPENGSEPPLLVAAVQARNNARVVVSGSLALFSNAFYRPDGGLATGNDLFCGELSKWAFGEAGVLRFRDIVHHKHDGSPPDVILHEKERPDLPLSLYPDPEITRNSLVYRIKDSIVYSMVVEQYSGQRGAWEPFSAPDMQMEFVMLDPYVRTTMVAHPATGRHVAEFMAPDSYGVFKFRVLYRREGYSVLHAETQVSIRPFKHNEYERFIYSAYPYYASALSATATFLVFSVLFIFMADSK